MLPFFYFSISFIRLSFSGRSYVKINSVFSDKVFEEYSIGITRGYYRKKWKTILAE